MMRLSNLMVLSCLLPTAAAASVVTSFNESQLVDKADVIVFGVVANTQNIKRSKIVVSTRVELQVYRALRGAKEGDSVQFELPGGDLDDSRLVLVAGSPRLAVGDMVFAFLRRHHNVYHPLGLSLGLLSITEIAPGDLRVSRSIGGLGVMTKQGIRTRPSAETSSQEKLSDFQDRIAQMVRTNDKQHARQQDRKATP